MAAVKMNWDMQKNQTKVNIYIGDLHEFGVFFKELFYNWYFALQASTEGRLTHYSVYSELAKLRQSETILFGTIVAEDISGCLVVSR